MNQDFTPNYTWPEHLFSHADFKAALGIPDDQKIIAIAINGLGESVKVICKGLDHGQKER